LRKNLRRRIAINPKKRTVKAMFWYLEALLAIVARA
jgi:hypothetical protein